jgi:hypothetical protein
VLSWAKASNVSSAPRVAKMATSLMDFGCM